MTPQPQSQSSSPDPAHRSSTTRATSHGDHSWADDARPARRSPAVSLTTFPISETAVSQADGEA